MIPTKKGDRWAPLRKPKPRPVAKPAPRTVHFDFETHDGIGDFKQMDPSKVERHVMRTLTGRVSGGGASYNWMSNPAVSVYDGYDLLRAVIPEHGWYRAPPRYLRTGVRILRGGKWGTITEVLPTGKENRDRFVVLPLNAGDTLVGMVVVKSSSYVTFDRASVPDPKVPDMPQYLK